MKASELRPEIPNLVVAHRQAGKVRRWHTENTVRQQTISDHVYNLMRIYLYIWGNPEPSLVCRMMFHDFEEFYLGDLPHWAACIPDFKTAYKKAEGELLSEFMEIPSSHAYDHRIKICDWIEALEFMMDECMLGNDHLFERMEKLYQKLEKEIYNEEKGRVFKYLDDSEWLDKFNTLKGVGEHGESDRGTFPLSQILKASSGGRP